MDVLALDVSMGKSLVVIYHNEICLLEAEIMHIQTGFAQLINLVESCETLPQVVFEARRFIHVQWRFFRIAESTIRF